MIAGTVAAPRASSDSTSSPGRRSPPPAWSPAARPFSDAVLRADARREVRDVDIIVASCESYLGYVVNGDRIPDVLVLRSPRPRAARSPPARFPRRRRGPQLTPPCGRAQ